MPDDLAFPDEPAFAEAASGDDRPAAWRFGLWLIAVPMLLVAAGFAFLLGCDAWRIEPVRGLVYFLYNAGGRGTFADALVMSLCSVPATAAGCAWLWRRGVNRGAAAGRIWRNVGLYAALGGLWLTGTGVALVSAFRALF